MGTDFPYSNPPVGSWSARNLSGHSISSQGPWPAAGPPCLSQPALMDLQDSAHDSHGPAIRSSHNRAALRILAGIPDSSSLLLILRKALISKSSSSWYSLQFPGWLCLFLQLLQHKLGRR